MPFLKIKKTIFFFGPKFHFHFFFAMFNEPYVPFKRTENDSIPGWFEIIVGPMFSGKTEELIRRMKRAVIAGQRTQIFKPNIDDRYHSSNVVSHDENFLVSEAIDDPLEILKRIKNEKVIGLDEVQFFPAGISDIIKALTAQGIRVIAAGLDKDYLGMPFDPVPNLMAEADYVTKLHAICVKCGAPASFSLRKSGGKEKFLLGEKENYEARCRSCFYEDN
jgi:thymidine kinase